jgi:hypothetical protein
VCNPADSADPADAVQQNGPEEHTHTHVRGHKKSSMKYFKTMELAYWREQYGDEAVDLLLVWAENPPDHKWPLWHAVHEIPCEFARQIALGETVETITAYLRSPGHHPRDAASIIGKKLDAARETRPKTFKWK